MLDIKISNKLKSKWINTAIGSLQADIVVKSSEKLLIEKLDEACNDFSENHKVEDISKLQVISDSRKAYKTIGKDPARYRLSSEALLRRIVKEKGIYKINNIVDINNLLSITSYYSICAFDVTKINPPIEFTIGTKEDEYYGIGRGLLNIENLAVFADQLGKFGSPTSDSERVKITNETTSISMNIISFSGVNDLELQLNKLKEYLINFAEGKNIEFQIIK
ncbi:MAG: phenylalanine--tRNA ligase beta subunit-related protein [Bacteroidales bacterium]|jgi:DNA/RNA-binding domain of Phe-tRNA-synthetase-like protein|nr:phenylalanine--tRNA ligase beta subunit-related protein [Bacteroidales bacterium]